MSIAHASSAPAEAKDNHARAGFWTLTLGSVGVVYGDIGTSPLYALKESLTAAAAGGALTREMVLGVMSLMLWALIVVVTLKYVLLIMRADNNGEGGTLDPDGAASARHGAQHLRGDAARHGRRGAVLRRRDHHAGDLGAVGGRGAEARDAGVRAFRHPVEPRDPRRAVQRAEPRHRGGRGLVRADHLRSGSSPWRPAG